MWIRNFGICDGKKDIAVFMVVEWEDMNDKNAQTISAALSYMPILDFSGKVIAQFSKVDGENGFEK